MTMMMQETAVRPLLEQMEEQARSQSATLEAAERDAQRNYDRYTTIISDRRAELRGFASLLGRSDQQLIAEFKDRPGWDRIPPETIPRRFRARQQKADRELYDAERERDAALLKLQRVSTQVDEIQSVVAEFELLMDQPDEVLVGFLRRRGWQIREIIRRNA